MATIQEQIAEFNRKFTERQQAVVDGITPQPKVRGETMSKCEIHKLVLTTSGVLPLSAHVHIIGNKPADVVDMECPECGLKLFIYYRTSEDKEE